MRISIKKCVAWCGNLRTEQDWQQWAESSIEYKNEDDLPALKQIPAMQRRRLSSFAKLTMHCVLEALGNESNNIPCIFSSRHGDLHKTSKLIADVAAKDDLSPTHFGLSVHNAVAGLYSIFANNKQPMTATSAGEDTLLMALVDAYAKLESQNLDRILVVYTDEVVPDKYKGYVPTTEKSIAIALIIEKSTNANIDNKGIDLNFTSQKKVNLDVAFQPLAFLSYFYGTDDAVTIESNRYQWHLLKS